MEPGQGVGGFGWFGGSERAGGALTTALSPDNTMFTPILAIRAAQNCGVISSAMRHSSRFAGFEPCLPRSPSW